MEKTVLPVLNLKLLDGCRLAIHGAADQMMPAQNLMKDDPVRKASEPHAKDDACRDQRILESHSAPLLPLSRTLAMG